MDRVTSTVIDLVETAYDLDLQESAWFRRLLEIGEPLFEKGFGSCIRVIERCGRGEPIRIHELYTTPNMPADWDEKTFAMWQSLPPAVLEIRSRPGTAHTQSELWALYFDEIQRMGLPHQFPQNDHSVRSAYPDAVRSVLEYGNKDGMIVTAIDPYGVGFYISLHLPEVTKLSEKERARWRMVGAHLAAGFRLRRGLNEQGAPTADRGVDEAEAILDPRSFSLAHAKGPAVNADARERLRDAAVRLDRVRGSLRKSDPEKSLEAWWALLHGRWSLVDWFDKDGRRFMLAHPNPPNVGDPRGLTQREAQVVAFAALGESQKLIRYRIGVSESLVSRALASAMHKLGVTTQAQLVEKLRGVPAVA